MRRRDVVALLVVLASSARCLPADERPNPGTLLVNVKRSDDAVDGFGTDDGWSVTFEHFAIALGDVEFDGATCARYGFSTYHRLFDFARAETSKLATMFALGTCNTEFHIRAPGNDAILMEGVSEQDRELMTARDTDVVRNEYLPAAMRVVGAATRGATTKRFSWLIRKEHRIGACFAPGSDKPVLEIVLDRDQALQRALEVRPRELFRVLPIHGAPTSFDRFAAADVNDDGIITLVELDDVPVSWGEVLDALRRSIPEGFREETDAVDPLMRPAPRESLATLMHGISSGRVVGVADSTDCDAGFYFDFPF